jgi:hypothetical protein
MSLPTLKKLDFYCLDIYLFRVGLFIYYYLEFFFFFFGIIIYLLSFRVGEWS